jgi:hypothetical protein
LKQGGGIPIFFMGWSTDIGDPLLRVLPRPREAGGYVDLEGRMRYLEVHGRRQRQCSKWSKNQLFASLPVLRSEVRQFAGEK